MKIKNDIVLTSKKFSVAEKIVIFLHGYGAKGNDFTDIALDNMSGKIDNAVFLFPDALYECESCFGGRMWFTLDDLSYDGIRKGLDSSAKYLFDFISFESEKYHVPLQNITLFGFSQGAIMSYEMMYYCGIGKIAAFSGLFAVPENKNVVNKNVEIFIGHGNDDKVVPYSNALLASKNLSELGIRHELHTFEGLDHYISNEGIEKSVFFILS